MDAEQLNQALFNKMSAEQEQFRHGLLGQTLEEILYHAHEYAMREDILLELQVFDLPAPQAAALLESPTPLADVYKELHDMDTDYMINVVQKSIKNRAEAMLTARREATRSIPLYQENVKYAKEHGEIELFLASLKANIACRDAIDTVIRENFDGYSLHADAKDVLAEFGPERVSHVLAATLLDRQHDQRFSRDNLAWAASVPTLDAGERHFEYGLNSHPAVLNGFVGLARKEIEAAREQAEKKPSIKAQLAAAKAAQAEKPAVQQHQKDKGAR